MQGVESKHPPGAVIMVTGELTRYAMSMQSLNSLQVPPNSGLIWKTGVLIAYSLNTALDAVLEDPRFQWVWIMGDDHLYHPNIVLKLLDHEKDVVLPLCLNRVPMFDPTIQVHSEKRAKYLEELPESGLYTLKADETCGDAGMLIRRNVLEATGPNWYDVKKSGSHNSEDQDFVEKIKEAGFEVNVDMDNRIGHVSHVIVDPYKTKDGWEVRMVSNSGKHIANFGQLHRNDP